MFSRRAFAIFFIHYHFASENKKHTNKYMPNDNKFTVYFYIKDNFLKMQVVVK